MIKNGNTNGKKALKELFNISSHQGNANKNCFEITSYKSEKPRSIKTNDNLQCQGCRVKGTRPSCIANGSANLYSHFGVW